MKPYGSAIFWNFEIGKLGNLITVEKLFKYPAFSILKVFGLTGSIFPISQLHFPKFI
jgi:hypothetical protein